MLVNSVIDLIGNTPLVKINNINTFGNEIYVKLEGSNPGRSTKDRIALKMIEEAEKEGLIDKDTVIMEATSGNTGIGLAMICAVKNYKLKIVMPDTMSVERIQLMRAYGTEVILTDGSLGMKACLDKLEELKKEEKKYFIPNQFTNPNNPKAHYENTAEEILRDMDNKVDVYICGTGTGGSFSGTAKKLKEKLPNIFKKINSIDEIINFYTADVNEYKKVIIIGDIHSCAEPLKEVLKDFSEENLYVFVGDYFDRGIQAVETFKIMLDLLEKPNVILIEGNHENNSVKKFINDEEKYTKSFD